jgi:cytochrome c peroxidase
VIKVWSSIALAFVFTAGCSRLMVPVAGSVATGQPAAASVEETRIALGMRLFFEPKLAGNQRMACAQCHMPKRGFSNGQATAAGITGARGRRNTPTVYALAGGKSFFWDGRAATLEEQALGPIENPIEMNAKLEDVLARLEAMPYYHKRFREVFGTPPTAAGLAAAIASFERAIKLMPSAYERWQAGDAAALTPSQQRGQRLFAGKARCASCHTGARLTDDQFHVTGWGLDQPEPDLGRFAVTHVAADRGAFKTPTLQNVAESAPYMHDGSLPTLGAVVDFFDKKDSLGLSGEEKADLVAFMQGLSAKDNLLELGKLPGIR